MPLFTLLSALKWSADQLSGRSRDADEYWVREKKTMLPSEERSRREVNALWASTALSVVGLQ